MQTFGQLFDQAAGLGNSLLGALPDANQTAVLQERLHTHVSSAAKHLHAGGKTAAKHLSTAAGVDPSITEAYEEELGIAVVVLGGLAVACVLRRAVCAPCQAACGGSHHRRRVHARRTSEEREDDRRRLRDSDDDEEDSDFDRILDHESERFRF